MREDHDAPCGRPGSGYQLDSLDCKFIMTPLVADPDNIRLAMLGMVDGNGHPYSWSAIINGAYDAQAMADCGFPGHSAVFGRATKENLGIAGAKVTHVWCDDPADAARVARAVAFHTLPRERKTSLDTSMRLSSPPIAVGSMSTARDRSLRLDCPYSSINPFATRRSICDNSLLGNTPASLCCRLAVYAMPASSKRPNSVWLPRWASLD